MPRQPRNLSNSKIYHIILKGIDSSNIFYSNQDRLVFIEKIKLVQEIFPFNLYAYCLMSNHVHMVLKSEDEFLSKSMQSLSQRYSRYFNTVYKRTGPLFQDRFYSRNVENQNYFLDVCRYVHRNPEKAGMSATSKYPWSSYSEYLHNSPKNIIDKKVLLYYFNNNIDDFIKFTNKSESIDEIINYADFEITSRISDAELIDIIKKLCKIKSIDEIFDFFKIKSNRAVLANFKDIDGVSVTQLSRITRVNRKAIEQILKSS